MLSFEDKARILHQVHRQFTVHELALLELHYDRQTLLDILDQVPRQQWLEKLRHLHGLCQERYCGPVSYETVTLRMPQAPYTTCRYRKYKLMQLQKRLPKELCSILLHRPAYCNYALVRDASSYPTGYIIQNISEDLQTTSYTLCQHLMADHADNHCFLYLQQDMFEWRHRLRVWIRQTHRNHQNSGYWARRMLCLSYLFLCFLLFLWCQALVISSFMRLVDFTT